MQKMTHRLTESLRRLAFENHDNCTVCSYEFKKADTTHLGYDKNEVERYVCDSCSSTLEETAVRHYFSPYPYEVPEQECRLWRYMDFTKYINMLSTSSLYFARADTFDDHFEGAKGVVSKKEKWDEYYLEFFKEGYRNPPEGVEWNYSEEQLDKEARRLLSEMTAGGVASRERIFISCWHENELESEAMWRLYSSFMDNAVAIKTTYSSLYQSLGKNPSIAIGRVKYIDFNKSYAGVNDSFWRKRKSFEHEREVRALVHDYRSEATGLAMECDLEMLVEEVIVSPSAPAWFVDVLKDVNSKFGLKASVAQSKLNDEPFY